MKLIDLLDSSRASKEEIKKKWLILLNDFKISSKKKIKKFMIYLWTEKAEMAKERESQKL